MTHERLKTWLSRDGVVQGSRGAGSRAGEDAALNLSLGIIPIHGAALALRGTWDSCG